jgi:tryptophanyl-tRNA synthetase
MEIVSEPSTVAHFNDLYNKCEIRYGDLKKQLAEDIISYTSPIRDRIIDILENDAYLAKVARMGAEKARESASKTLAEVKEVVGFRKLF